MQTKQDRPPNPLDGQPVDYTRPVRSALYQQLSPDTPEVSRRQCHWGWLITLTHWYVHR